MTARELTVIGEADYNRGLGRTGCLDDSSSNQRRPVGTVPGGSMRRPSRIWWHVLTVATAVVAVVAAVSARATEADMNRLPVTGPFLCRACHAQPDPVSGSAALNVFGEDFLANGRRWDENLAQEDSDGDGCLNGVEIGDSDGDGEPDGNVQEQASNPGVVDECGSGQLVDEKTWGALKALFDGR
jgi:hypothetical protein